MAGSYVGFFLMVGRNKGGKHLNYFLPMENNRGESSRVGLFHGGAG